MTDLAAYRFVLLERECVKNRTTCNKDCNSCSYFTDLKDVEKALTRCIEVLKARNPQLYLATELEQLQEVVRVETKYKLPTTDTDLESKGRFKVKGQT